MTYGRMIAAMGVLALVLGLTGEARADKKSDLQKRFKERLAQIDALKMDGKLGETWEGYVEAVNDTKLTEKQQKLVDAENDDRKALYEIIAEDEKTTVEKVGQINASRNYKKGKKGDWFKLKNGTWKQKEKE